MPEPKAENPQCHIHDDVYGNSSWDDFLHETVCVNDLPLTKHIDGRHYCLFHLPTKEKDVAQFEERRRARLIAVEAKLAEIERLPENKREWHKRHASYDFQYVWFPSKVRFHEYTFVAKAKFHFATFGGDADFSFVTFVGEADFSSATFTQEANFRGARFAQDIDFRWTTFSETSEAFFQHTRFCKEANFNYSTLAGYVAFEGMRDEKVFLDKKAVLETQDEFKQRFENFKLRFAEKNADFQVLDDFGRNQEAVLDLQNARLEKPERISFHRVRLCPGWFVNIDSRKMVFTDIRWDNLDAKSNNSNIATELENLKNRVSEPSRLLEIACRQLGVNAEENNRYEEASKFRYMAMETKRLEYWGQGRFWTLNWWYRFSSGYGEDWKRAWLVLLGVLLFFGLLYWSPLSTFDYGEKKDDTVLYDVIEKESDWTRKYDERFHRMSLGKGLVHSVYVAALQRPEPKAADVLTRLFIILETIFAPLQAALLALAIRRKFMR